MEISSANTPYVAVAKYTSVTESPHRHLHGRRALDKDGSPGVRPLACGDFRNEQFNMLALHPTGVELPCCTIVV
jgi:hypothetical protein